MIARLGRIAANTIIWAIILLLVVLPALGGSGASVLAALLALLLSPVFFTAAVRQDLIRQPAMLLFLGAFLAVLVSYAISARDPGNMLYAISFIGLILALPLYGATRWWNVATPERSLAGLAVVGSVICAIVVLYDRFYNGADRATGFMMGANELARIGMVLAALGLSSLLLTQSRWRFAAYAGPVAATIVLVLTGTRGALPMLPAMGLVTAAFLAFSRRETAHAIWHLLFTALLTALAILASQRFDALGGVLNDVLTNGQASSDGATAERLAMLRGAFGAFFHSPWVGFGWANLKPAASLAMDMTVYGTEPGGAFQFHNDLANIGVAAGAVGILSWLMVLAAPIVGALCGPRDGLFQARAYCCVQLSLGFAISGLTDLNYGYELPTTLYVFLTALVLGLFQERAGTPPLRREGQ